ncbi:hypothetical protein THAOC_26949 [Thalassiosira oceanica]|uniref:Uncharacterized protein n=1 Tax=Thalassiosira oceanica TaxID=159749 RepID=K0RMV1_THAOC|nr:hypothetical protein THAOC_26949 [Thalassiosira oceanica]|eukprot:EJK53584.1 hypothetical protein THAOC_26949 [Thalassiosira oceanica]
MGILASDGCRWSQHCVTFRSSAPRSEHDAAALWAALYVSLLAFTPIRRGFPAGFDGIVLGLGSGALGPANDGLGGPEKPETRDRSRSKQAVQVEGRKLGVLQRGNDHLDRHLVSQEGGFHTP